MHPPIRVDPTSQPTGPKARITVTSERHRQRILRDLEQAFRDLDQRPDALEVQLVVQVVRAETFPKWRAEREAAWREQDDGYTSTGWPVKKLGPSEYAALLLPIPAGRVGLAVGNHPRVIADPLFASGTPARAGNYDDLVLGLIASWVGAFGNQLNARLAPSMIEAIGRRGVLERRVETFGLSWPLAPPDGA